MFLYSAVSSQLDRSKRFTFHPLSDLFIPTPLDFSGKHAAITHEYCSILFPPPIARYSFIQLSELGRRGENKNAQLRNGSTSLDISTSPHGPAHLSDRRASTFYLSLARTGHLDICRATRFQIVVARTMTNHSMYFLRGRPSHISAVFACPFATPRRQRDASRSQACQSNTLTSVFRSRRTRYVNANIRDASGHFSPRSTWHGFE